jgi:hypothetical protein
MLRELQVAKLGRSKLVTGSELAEIYNNTCSLQIDAKSIVWVLFLKLVIKFCFDSMVMEA